MRIILITVILFFGALSLKGDNTITPKPEQLKCREGRTLYKCEEVKDSKRKKFCSKFNNLTKKHITKACQRITKKRKDKK